MRNIVHHGLSRRHMLAGGLGLAAAPALASTPGPSPDFAPVAARANEVIAGRFAPGLSIAVLHKGRFVYSRGFGLANIETNTPLDPASVLRIGSITKQFTAVALLRLQEAGLLSIDDRLDKTIPEVPRAGEISLRQMLDHTAGLGNFTDPIDGFMKHARSDYSQAELLKAMLATDPMYIDEPGTRYVYSNTAYVLLGLVIERVTGKPYAETFKPILAAAGMARSAVDDVKHVVPGRASGYTPDPAAASGFANAGYVAMNYPAAAGNMRSTTEDLCRWHEALLGNRILKPASLRQMLTPGTLANGKPATSVTKAEGATPARSIDYGLGIAIERTRHGRELAHGGAIMGFTSWVGSYPDAALHLAYIVNADSGFTGKTGFFAAVDKVKEAALSAVLG